MPKVVAIASDHMAVNLALTGMHVDEVKDSKEAEKLLGGYLDSDTSVVILQETLRGAFSERFNNRLSRHRGTPLLVNCPVFEQEDSDVDAYLSAVLKPAIGYEIRLE
jgi:vacuolar-type H+-ATPase subunit F/Vma7